MVVRTGYHIPTRGGVLERPEVTADRLTDGGDPARSAGEPCSPNKRGGSKCRGEAGLEWWVVDDPESLSGAPWSGLDPSGQTSREEGSGMSKMILAERKRRLRGV